METTRRPSARSRACRAARSTTCSRSTSRSAGRHRLPPGTPEHVCHRPARRRSSLQFYRPEGARPGRVDTARAMSRPGRRRVVRGVRRAACGRRPAGSRQRRDPRIEPRVRDMSYGVRQFVVGDPGGNYIRRSANAAHPRPALGGPSPRPPDGWTGPLESRDHPRRLEAGRRRRGEGPRIRRSRPARDGCDRRGRGARPDPAGQHVDAATPGRQRPHAVTCAAPGTVVAARRRGARRSSPSDAPSRVASSRSRGAGERVVDRDVEPDVDGDRQQQRAGPDGDDARR